jgi:hypothetical protein
MMVEKLYALAGKMPLRQCKLRATPTPLPVNCTDYGAPLK